MRSVLLISLVVVGGCFDVQDPVTGDGDTDGPLPWEDGPGAEIWGEADVSCVSQEDCLEGEVCSDNICQPEKCAGALLKTDPPIGDALTFYEDGDLAFADPTMSEGAYWIDGYKLSSTASYAYSWEVSNTPITDLTGGNFLGTRPDGLAAISEDSTYLVVTTNGTPKTVDLGFIPVAVDAGDLDGDGLDEAVAVRADGYFAICDIDRAKCSYRQLGGSLEALDIAVGDLDDDGIGEPTFLVLVDGQRHLYSYNLDAEDTGQVLESWGAYPDGKDDNPVRIDSGDLDGDGVAEIVGIWDGGCFELCSDSLRVWRPTISETGNGTYTRLAEVEMTGDKVTHDLAVSDTDRDDEAEVWVLFDDGEYQRMNWYSGTLDEAYRSVHAFGTEPIRIGIADHDGDSPRAKLSNNVQECTGATVPVMLLTFPPYDKDHSENGSRTSYGENSSVSEGFEDTLSMGMSVDVGVSAELWGAFGVSMSTKVSRRVSQNYGETYRVSTGSRYGLRADPAVHGSRYGGVVLSWGCFDGYTYDLDDPKGYLGDRVDGEQLVLTVPTGGGVSLWSTPRYNALAKALGTLPVIDIPYDVGVVDSYPSSPQTLEGEPLTNSDLLFPNPPTSNVSDVGWVDWRQDISTSQSNGTRTSVDLGLSMGVKVGGVSVGGGVSHGWGRGYRLTVGESARFGGALPPMPDHPDTPEDEFAEYAYGVTPYVYTQTYTDAQGNEGAYYVQTYSVVK